MVWDSYISAKFDQYREEQPDYVFAIFQTPCGSLTAMLAQLLLQQRENQTYYKV